MYRLKKRVTKAKAVCNGNGVDGVADDDDEDHDSFFPSRLSLKHTTHTHTSSFYLLSVSLLEAQSLIKPWQILILGLLILIEDIMTQRELLISNCLN